MGHKTWQIRKKKAVLVSKGMRSIVSDDNEAAHLICYNPSCGSRVQFGINASFCSKRRDTLMTVPMVQYLPPRLSHTPSIGFQRPSLRREPQTETLGLLSLSSEWDDSPPKRTDVCLMGAQFCVSQTWSSHGRSIYMSVVPCVTPSGCTHLKHTDAIRDHVSNSDVTEPNDTITGGEFYFASNTLPGTSLGLPPRPLLVVQDLPTKGFLSLTSHKLHSRNIRCLCMHNIFISTTLPFTRITLVCIIICAKFTSKTLLWMRLLRSINSLRRFPS